MILEACEAAAFAAGFRRLEMGATLTGVPFYRAKGYMSRTGEYGGAFGGRVDFAYCADGEGDLGRRLEVKPEVRG